MSIIHLHQVVGMMNGKVQKYTMPHNEDDSRELARPGQFVHESNESDMVSGFITAVDDYGMTFCLFDAIEYKDLPRNAVPVQGEMTKDEMAEELRVALELNPGMKLAWAKAINGETVQ